MDVVLGVSMAPMAVRMVLMEGERAGGVTLDQDDFHVGPAPAAAANQVIEAILGTRESVAEGGHRLQSSGVTWTSPAEAAALRDALARHKIDNVMLVSAFMAAAALAQAVGSATRCARTALLFVEPTSATLAIVDSSDGAIIDVQRRGLPHGGNAVVACLAAMISAAASTNARPDGVFLVGSGVDIPRIKPALDAVTSLSVIAPEEPEMALARGAALASVNEQLKAPSTVAIPYLAELADAGELAYSAVPDEKAGSGSFNEFPAEPRKPRTSRARLALAAAVVICVSGAVALALALAFEIRTQVDQRPGISKNVVAPAPQAPPPKVEPPAAPPDASLPVETPPPLEAPTQEPVPETPQQVPQDHHHDWFHRHFGAWLGG